MNSWRSSFLILDFASELGVLVSFLYFFFFCVDNDEDPFVYNVAGSGRLQFGFSCLYTWIVYPDSSFNENILKLITNQVIFRTPRIYINGT